MNKANNDSLEKKKPKQNITQSRSYETDSYWAL